MEAFEPIGFEIGNTLTKDEKAVSSTPARQ